MDLPPGKRADYVIVGGGLCGCVLASRLSMSPGSPSVVLIEAGGLPDNHPLIGPPLACFAASQTELDWNYTTVAQRSLNGKECYASGGKVLSGGTAINRGTWSKGSAADYDEWARLVKDDGFSFAAMQPYFARTQMHTERVSVTRQYPLRNSTKAMLESSGIAFNQESNSGVILGFEEYEENWKQSQRQLSSTAYDLSLVDVLCDTHVARVLTEDDGEGVGRAIGVETDTGVRIHATREVIVSAGAYRTPQILLLSGIGPTDELDKHGIPTKVESPHVGLNFHDHFCSFLWWKLREPEQGLSMGSARFAEEKSYRAGLPADWIMWQRCPSPQLNQALEKDGYDCEGDPTGLLHPARAHAETIFFYSAPGGLPAKVSLPADGTLIGQSIFLASPTSRGSIGLRSRNPQDSPVIDPNYYSTHADRTILQNAMQQVHRIFVGNPIGRQMVAEEYLPEDIKHCTSDSQEHIDARIKRIGGTLYHAGGSASMGKVVDSHFRVKGLRGLRVVDASVVPLPLAAHSQACLYAMAEKAADDILFAV